MATVPEADTALVLTPTSRLARVEKRRRDEARAARAAAWATPPVRSLYAWLAELRHQALLTGALPEVPVTTAQARPLWRQVIDREIFVGEPRVAELAERAWRLIHEYRLRPPEAWEALQLSPDSERFAQWARRFRALCRKRQLVDEWTFAARLPRLVRQGALELPTAVRLTGFELDPPPLQAELFAALREAGVALERPAPDPAPDSGPLPVGRYADPDEELLAAARWARRRLEAAPATRVAVVIPDLAGRLGRVERIFRAVFDPPGFALEERGTPPWHLSLGPPLAAWPLVADALTLLALAPQRLDQPRAARLLRCPWIAGWPEEHPRRAAAEARLMREAPFELTARELGFALERAGAGHLRERLSAWRATRGEHREAARPSDWAARFQLELAALGFGHGRALDSREWQALERWHALLGEFAGLDLTVDAPVRRGPALALLRDRAASTTFRERDPGCPIEILGVQEALGARFDAAWLASLDRDSWPAPARRDPLIPGPVQAPVPASTPEGCRERAREELAGLLRIAPALRGSLSRGEEEAPRECTPLVRATVTDAAEDPAPGPAPEFETLAGDTQAPALTTATLRGGTAVLRDQSACPFRALAIHRLGARELAPPRPGLDAAARGTLVHRALETFWENLPDRAALLALSETARRERVGQAVREALDALLARYRLALSAAGRRLEQQCTERLLERWLTIEAGRGDFRVLAREAPIALSIGPLKLSGKVDRVDGTDAGPVLLDYKTGAAARGDWLPRERLRDPQLPAYALGWPEPPAALAFAHLRPDKLGFEGLAREDVGIDDVPPVEELSHGWRRIEDYGQLLGDWRRSLEALAGDFAAGAAPVDPRDAEACRRCHLQALCRIHERASRVDDDEGAP